MGWIGCDCRQSEPQVQTVEKLRHRPTGHDRKIAAEQHPIKTAQRPVNAILIFVDEALHRSILHFQASRQVRDGIHNFRQNPSMKDFRNLKVWEKAHQLALALYTLTESFPRQEVFGLASQIRRAASSIPSNIAEGCGRQGDAELARFCIIARGSAAELEYQLLLARDLKLILPRDYEKLSDQTVEIKRMLTVLIQKLTAEG
jgi:four helix bundle protein